MAQLLEEHLPVQRLLQHLCSGGSAVFGLDPAIITATARYRRNCEVHGGRSGAIKVVSVATTTVTPFVAKCSWVEAASGPTILGGTLTPTDAVNFTSVDAAAFTVKVGIPVQGVVSPIHLYVDTVLAGGSSGPLAPRFGVSCAITSQFIVGQTIVLGIWKQRNPGWRCYGSN